MAARRVMRAGLRMRLPVPHGLFLSRIRKLFVSIADPHFASIEDGFRSGRLKRPVRPLSDKELAREIRELRASPAAEWMLRKGTNRFEKK